MADPAAVAAQQIRNIEQATGRTVADWAGLVSAAGLTRHGEIIAFLKQRHGLTHGNANALAHKVRETAAGGPASSDELLAAQYAGAKAPLRRIYDEVVLVAQGLGEDVTLSVKKTGVSLRRARQFGVVEAPSAKRVELGLNLKGTAPTGRLREARGMCTHRVALVDASDVDDEVAAWLRNAYELAGPA